VADLETFRILRNHRYNAIFREKDVIEQCVTVGVAPLPSPSVARARGMVELPMMMNV
jgi:hypothetical protein